MAANRRDHRAEIMEVFKRLPAGELISDEELRRLASGIFVPYFFAALERAPRFHEATPIKANAEIIEYGKLCHALGLHIGSMSKTAHDLIRNHNPRRAPDPLDLLDDLVHAIEAANAARLEIDAVDGPRGPKGKPLAREITVAATKAYERITGRRATRVAKDGIAGGEYLDFLSHIFRILDVGASPEGQARAMEIMRSRGGL